MYETTKRAFDFFCAAWGLVLLSPILILASIAIKLDSPGPILYRGPRVGKNGKLFDILKFRTMRNDADSISASSSCGDGDPRVTKLGEFLRKTKINELPQLVNVLLGEMSLVGPRPQVKWDVDNYTEEERVILTVPPGITDFASIEYHDEGKILAGAEDPDKAYIELIRPGKIRLQLKYIRERSLWTDFKILFRTVSVLFQSRTS